MNYWLKPFLMDEAGEGKDLGGTDDGDDARARGDFIDDEDDDDDDDAKAAAAKAEEEEEAPAKAKADADAKAKDVTIPKARFDEAVGKERAAREAAEKRLKELEQQGAAAEAAADTDKLRNEIEELEEQYEGLLAEGSKEDRAKVRRQIRNKERQLAETQANARANYATALAVEQVRYDAQVEKVEKDYDFLNQDSESFSEDMAGEVLERKGAYEAAGMASSEALKKAVRTLKPQLEELKAKLTKKDDDEGEDKGEDKEAGVKAAETAAKRRADAVAKGTEAKSKQPADTTRGGKGKDPASKSLDIKMMSDADFDKLTPEQLAALRGDNG